MEQTNQQNELGHMTLDGKAIQPEKKRYRIWFLEESVTCREDEAENEEQLLRWLYDCVWKYDQTDLHTVVRVDDLGVVKNGRPIEERCPKAEFLATAGELYAAWLKRHQERAADKGKAKQDMPSPEEMPGPSDSKRYRIWYLFVEMCYLDCQVENVMQAGQFFVKWCSEDVDGITTYELQYIEELGYQPDWDAWEREFERTSREAREQGLTDAEREDRLRKIPPPVVPERNRSDGGSQPTKENPKFRPEDLGWHTTRFGMDGTKAMKSPVDKQATDGQ